MGYQRQTLANLTGRAYNCGMRRLMAIAAFAFSWLCPCGRSMAGVTPQVDMAAALAVMPDSVAASSGGGQFPAQDAAPAWVLLSQLFLPAAFLRAALLALVPSRIVAFRIAALLA